MHHTTCASSISSTSQLGWTLYQLQTSTTPTPPSSLAGSPRQLQPLFSAYHPQSDNLHGYQGRSMSRTSHTFNQERYTADDRPTHLEGSSQPDTPTMLAKKLKPVSTSAPNVRTVFAHDKSLLVHLSKSRSEGSFRQAQIDTHAIAQMPNTTHQIHPMNHIHRSPSMRFEGQDQPVETIHPEQPLSEEGIPK